MVKNYQISNNIIFSVNDDGSITKFATISESGEICRIGESIKQPVTKPLWGYWVAIVLFVVATIIAFVLYISMKERYDSQYRQNRTLMSQYETLKSQVGNAYPLRISEIEIANSYRGGDIETDYGNTIYSSNTMYLKPRIKYYGISSGTKTLKIKWFKPDGSMSTGTSSPYGFSQSDSHYIYSGADNSITLSGWGNENKGHWRSGSYRIEIWYENTCLKSKSFTIY